MLQFKVYLEVDGIRSALLTYFALHTAETLLINDISQMDLAGIEILARSQLLNVVTENDALELVVKWLSTVYYDEAMAH